MIGVVEVESGSLEVASSDARRTICEYNFTSGSVQSFEIKKNATLGNHFHKDKIEIFMFVEGGGTVKTACTSRESGKVGEIKEFQVISGSVIKIPPHHTHRLDLVKGTRFLVYSSMPFDANNMDMISCPI